MPYDGKTSGNRLMVAITKATGEDGKMCERAMPGMGGIALLIKGKKTERDEVAAVLLDLAEASIKAHEEKDAAAVVRIWRYAHDVLCEMRSAHMAPEEAED